MRAIHLSVLIVGLTVASTVLAQDVGMAEAGAGVTSCGQFANQYRISPESTELFFYSWAEGYMTALNNAFAAAGATRMSRDLSSEPTSEQRADIRRYCDAHPLEEYEDAVFTLYKSLAPGEWAIKHPN